MHPREDLLVRRHQACLRHQPSGRTATGMDTWDPDVGEHLSIEDLTPTARVCTATIIDVCSSSRLAPGLPVLSASLPSLEHLHRHPQGNAH
jgi:hypothetical protein